MERKPVIHIDVNATKMITGSAGQLQYVSEVVNGIKEQYGENYTLIFKVVFNN